MIAGLGTMGWFHLGYFGLLIPASAVRSKKKLLGTADQPAPLSSRMAHFQRTAATLILFTGLSLLTAWRERMTLFPHSLPPLTAVIAGLAMYAITVAFMRPRWRRAVETRKRVVHLFMPDNATERVWWIVVALLAGVGEEITWRGVQASLTSSLAGNVWIAAVITSISFAFAHYVQGWRSVAVIFVMALGFHTLVWFAGSLYVAMAVHVAYDITAGLSYGRLGRELGYGRDGCPPEPSKI